MFGSVFDKIGITPELIKRKRDDLVANPRNVAAPVA